MHANFPKAPNQKRETRNGSIIDKVPPPPRNSQPPSAVANEPVAVPERREPVWLRPIVLVLAAICLIGMFSTEVSGYDTWWLLTTGGYIVYYRALTLPCVV